HQSGFSPHRPEGTTRYRLPARSKKDSHASRKSGDSGRIRRRHGNGILSVSGLFFLPSRDSAASRITFFQISLPGALARSNSSPIRHPGTGPQNQARSFPDFPLAAIPQLGGLRPPFGNPLCPPRSFPARRTRAPEMDRGGIGRSAG